MVDHLQDAAAQARLGQREHAEHDVTEVTDGRAGDQALDVGLRHREESAVDDSDRAEPHEERRPGDGGFGEHADAESQ